MLEMTKVLNIDIIELETKCNATVMKSKLFSKNIFQFFIYIPDRITVTTDDEGENAAGPSGVRQGVVAHSNLLAQVIQFGTLLVK